MVNYTYEKPSRKYNKLPMAGSSDKRTVLLQCHTNA